MSRTVRFLACLLFALAAQAAFAAPADTSPPAAAPLDPHQEAVQLAAAYRAIFAPPAVAAEPAGAPGALPLVVPPGKVACCRPFPACCSTTASEDACSDIGGYSFPTTQQCAGACC